MNLPLIKNSTRYQPYLNRAPLPPPVRTVAELSNLDPSDAGYGRAVCLTFDDGPDPEYTPGILRVLDDFDVKATFFVLGQAAERYPHLVEQMIKAGHTIGNHTYSHRHPWLISSEQAGREVTRANTVVSHITGSAPRWFRPPFGRLRTAMRRQAQLEQMQTVLWNHSIIDWGVMGTKAGISKRLAQIKPGDVVLMHDGKREHNHPEVTLACLPPFLQSLADRSLRAFSLDEVGQENASDLF